MVENKKKREKSGRMRRPPEQLEQIIIISRVALVVKNLPANAGDIGYLGLIPGGGKIPLEEEMLTHSSILAWRIP